MVQKLLAPKRDGLHPDYEREFFERCLHEAFDVRRSEEPRVGHPGPLLRDAASHLTRMFWNWYGKSSSGWLTLFSNG